MQKYGIVISVLVAVCILTSREYKLLAQNQLQIHIAYVEQGDGIVIISPTGKQVVIDGGPNLDLLSFLGKKMPWFDRTIEPLILTHPDLDHLAALPEILRRYTVKTIMLTGIEHSSGRYEELLHLIHTKNIPVLLPKTGQVFALGGGATLEVLWPNTNLLSTKPDHPNDTSVVLRATYGNESMLLTGDIEEAAETALLATGQNVQATHLKVGHHGSKTSTSTGFLLAVNPTYAIISAGKDNKFGHPHQEVLTRLEHFTIPWWNTAEDGDYVVKFSK